MRVFKYVVFLALISFVMLSCATGPNLKDLPEWVLQPPSAEDAIYGVGQAKMSSLSMSQTMATSRARDDIARQVKITVKNAITDYAQEAGEGDNKQTIEFVEIVSRQLVDVELQGLKTKEYSYAKDGTVYALVEYPMNAFKEDVNEAFERNEAAAFAEFKASKALDQLNHELETNPPRAGGE
jgi:hypothetical protein